MNLIEASAGTGKTYTMAGLFLRLLLEEGLTVDQVLVVTFTEIATDELRIRIRNRLRDAIRAFRTGEAGNDAALQLLLERVNDHCLARTQLEDALRDFDNAAISTIHGFCHRVLGENAFESGVTFGTELVQDDASIRRQIIVDFWRRQVHGAHELYVDYLAANKGNPDTLMELANVKKGALPLRLVPELDTAGEAVDEAKLIKEAGELIKEVISQWRSGGKEIANLLKHAAEQEILSKTSYRDDSIDALAADMDAFAAAQAESLVLPDKFKNLTPAGLKKGTRKNKVTPHHDFFTLCGEAHCKAEELSKAFQRRIIELRRECLENLETEYRRIKKERSIQSFDDLLLDVHRALKGEQGPALARQLREKYRAALIDEFQDTDPVQFEIFEAVYAGHDDRPLFLIGDPKQSIYAFRGADIFSYLKARRQALDPYPLKVNWRSEDALVRAVNTLFDSKRVKNPFLYDQIEYVKVDAAPEGDDKPEPLTIDGESTPPLRLWFLSRTGRCPDPTNEALLDQAKNSTDPIPKKRVWRDIDDRVATEAARLINLGRAGRALIGKRGLEPRDIAILVRANWQADSLQQALKNRNVASVVYSTASLMKSPEIEELHRIFSAIASWRDARLVKGALASRIMGLSGNDLEALVRDEQRWEDRLLSFRLYHELWQGQGFIQMFREFLVREHVGQRLLALPNGERRMTNILHAAELLQREAVERRLGMAGLIKWLADQRAGKGEVDEEKQQRLESDEKRVKIITIHRVKGLEFPVTFCPFLWDGYLHTSFVYHDREHDDRLTLDLRMALDPQEAALVKQEECAENLRLAYVALTRARNLCYTIAGPIEDYATSPLAYLLHQDTMDMQPDGGSLIDSVAQRVVSMTDDVMKADLRKVEERAQGGIQVSEMPGRSRERVVAETPDTAHMEARQFTGKIDGTWRVTSYSGLAGEHRMVPLDEPDRDQDDLAEETPAEPEDHSIFTLPRGAGVGNMIHWLFEHLDFAAAGDAEQRVLDALQRARFDPKWAEVVTDMVTKVLQTPLLEDGDLTLASVTPDRTLCEMEFYYPLAPITAQGMTAIFERHGRAPDGDAPEKIGRLVFSPRRGFLKGFIDLIFEHDGRYYIVDYKSNSLGMDVQAYRQERLALAMAAGNYTLQYHVYAVALHRYLQKRISEYDYEKHFGGVFYLFVRGMDPKAGPEYGVFADRPSVGLIADLSEYFEGGGRVGASDLNRTPNP